MSQPFDYKRASDESEQQLAHPMVEDAFPYRAYSAVFDARTSKSHRSMESLGLNGTAIFHKSDPAWQAFRPPWGARHCRCGWWPVSIEDAASKGVKEAKQWLETGVEPRHQFVTFPKFSLDSICEPGALYLSDNPLILGDLQSGHESRVKRAIGDLKSLVPGNKKFRQLRDSLMTAPELIGMADLLIKIDKNALAAWPTLISCFVSRMSNPVTEESVTWKSLVFEAMRQVLHTGGPDYRETILPIWIASEDATTGTLVEILSCKHWDVRRAASERLGQFGRGAAEAITSLERLRSDRSKYVRAAAEDAINRIRSS